MFGGGYLDKKRVALIEVAKQAEQRVTEVAQELAEKIKSKSLKEAIMSGGDEFWEAWGRTSPARFKEKKFSIFGGPPKHKGGGNKNRRKRKPVLKRRPGWDWAEL